MPVLVPAYGRDYKSRAAALADFNAGKDFILTGWDVARDVIVNKPQLAEAGYVQISIRYDSLRKVVIANLAAGEQK